MEDCVYEKTTEKIHCCECLEAFELVMRALRKDGKLVGHVWMCPKCAGEITALDAEFSPIYKNTVRPVAVN